MHCMYRVTVDWWCSTVIVFIDMLSSASETDNELSDDDNGLSVSDGNKQKDHFQETATA